MHEQRKQDTQPMTLEALAVKYKWENFPERIQNKLFAHYTRFFVPENVSLAERDVQSASDTLYWVTQGKSPHPFLDEHVRYFGQASTNDLTELVREISTSQDYS